jgi:GntR family transcriptional repressor for pyruvate dehydrogenase complex
MINNDYAFANVKQCSAAERIVDNIIQLIRERKLAQGDKLPPERELCQIVGVSRPILREALKALQVLGIIDVRQGSGAFVRQLSPQEIVEHLDVVFHLDKSLYHDLYEARKILEAETARAACGKMTSEELDAIERNIREAEECVDDAADFARLDIEMHEMIMQAAGNRVVPVFMRSIMKLSNLARHETNARSEIRLKTAQDHRLILEALKSGNGQAAAEAMALHITNVGSQFLAGLKG